MVQASEKIYKAAKDTVKILAKTHTPDIYREAATRGRWTASLLDKVVRAYSERMWEWDVACCPGNEKIKRKKTYLTLSYIQRNLFTKRRSQRRGYFKRVRIPAYRIGYRNGVE